MPTRVLIELTDSETNEASAFTQISFLADINNFSAAITATTDGDGKAIVLLDPGEYTVYVSTAIGTRKIGKFTVKSRKIRHFSGIENLNGAFPLRFGRNTYNHSANFMESPLEQRISWRIQ